MKNFNDLYCIHKRIKVSQKFQCIFQSLDAACKLFEIGRNNDDFWVVGRMGGGGGTADWLWASRLSYTAFTHSNNNNSERI